MLLDIDGTLIARGRRRAGVAGVHETLPALPLTVRPHVVEFLRGLLVDRILDTTRVRVLTSLFTRQPQSYCSSVAAELTRLAHAGSLHGVDGGGGENEGECMQFTCLLAGDVCCGGPSSQHWRKSVSVTGQPFTTLLVDDTVENFVDWECTTGHCLLVPSYRAEVDAAPSSLQDAPYALQGGGAFASAGHASDEPPLLPVLGAFVRVCHDAADTVEEAHRQYARALAVPHPVTARSGKALRALDFLSHPQAVAYSVQWEAFHQSFEMDLGPIFARAASEAACA